jgi:DNA-directed RNA polymerase subunit RPC12/RpoP
MAVTVAREVIACGTCGHRRVVTDRSRRRSEQKGGIPCANCRGVGATKRVSDGDLRFWLRRFGASPPRGTPIRQFITAGGAPPELVELAREAFPDAIVSP